MHKDSHNYEARELFNSSKALEMEMKDMLFPNGKKVNPSSTEYEMAINATNFSKYYKPDEIKTLLEYYKEQSNYTARKLFKNRDSLTKEEYERLRKDNLIYEALYRAIINHENNKSKKADKKVKENEPEQRSVDGKRKANPFYIRKNKPKQKKN